MIDARTLYDVMQSRADDPKATRTDVELAAIALRNFNFVAGVALADQA